MTNRSNTLCAVAAGGLLLCSGVNAQSVSISGYADPGACANIEAPTTAIGGQYVVFLQDGTWSLSEDVSGTTTVLDSGTWVSGPFSASNYEIRAVGTLYYDHESGGGSSCQDPDNYYETSYNSGWSTLVPSFLQPATGVYTQKDAFCYWAQDINGFTGTFQIRQISNHSNTDTISVNLCARGYAY